LTNWHDYARSHNTDYDNNNYERSTTTLVSENHHAHHKDPAARIREISSYPIKGYPDRKISKETMEFFGVRAECSESDGSVVAYHYPDIQEDGRVVSYKRRGLPKTFSCVGKPTGLFGRNKTVGNNYVIVVEGEQDVLAGREIMLKHNGKAYNIEGLPTGTSEDGSLHKIVKAELERLSSFKTVVICLDMDGPGQMTARTLADELCIHTEVKMVNLPAKDTAEMWENGQGEHWMRAIRNAKPYTSDQVVRGDDCPPETLLEPLEPGVFFGFIPKTCRKLDGFRPRELTTIIGPPNCGKSSLMRQMMYESLVQTDKNVAAFYLEETPKKTRQSIIAYHAGVSLSEFRRDPSVADKHKVQEAIETLLPRLHLFDHSNRVLKLETFERKLEFMVKALDCRIGFLDHLSFLIGGINAGNERQAIDLTMTKLARAVEDWDFTMFQVSHIKRGVRTDGTGKKDDPDKYPYWETLDMSDGRGSGSIEQCSHNMIALERQILSPSEEDMRGKVRTRILRAREIGTIGMGDELGWDKQSGMFVPHNF
jgi:twinkle protein